MEKTNKLRKIAFVSFAIIYFILILSDVEISKNIFIILISTILVSQAIDEWNRYKEIKHKVNLIIPIITVCIILFLILKFANIIWLAIKSNNY